MVHNRRWTKRLAEAASAQGEPLPGIPIVEITGQNRVLIECHRGVTQYSPESIGVKVSYGEVFVCGCGLKLCVMSKERLVISGRIAQIRLDRRDG